MRTVWKYELPVGNAVTVREMPSASALLPFADCPGGSGSVVAIWAVVETDTPMVPRHFTVVGTGHPVPPGGKYITSAIWHVTDGAVLASPLVWHVFEVEP